MMTGVMMTNLSAAYDLWDHEIGLEEVQLLGLEPAACAWAASYISGRSQSCSVDSMVFHFTGGYSDFLARFWYAF